MPGRFPRALRKAARSALVASLAFLFGRFVVDDLDVAIVGTFTAFALSSMADFPGPPGARVSAYLLTGLAGAPLVALAP